MKKVNFPQFINRSRLFFIFEIDMILIFFSTFLSILWVISKFFPYVIAIPISVYLAYVIMDNYNIAKYEKAPGFIQHYFYNIGLFKIKKNFRKYPELEIRDNKNFYPSGYIRNFRD